jgi:hypothetical protein
MHFGVDRLTVITKRGQWSEYVFGEHAHWGASF